MRCLKYPLGFRYFPIILNPKRYQPTEATRAKMSKRKREDVAPSPVGFDVGGFDSATTQMPDNSTAPRKIMRRSSTFGGSVGSAKLKRRGSVSETPRALQPSTEPHPSSGGRPPLLSFQSSADLTSWDQLDAAPLPSPSPPSAQLLSPSPPPVYKKIFSGVP